MEVKCTCELTCVKERMKEGLRVTRQVSYAVVLMQYNSAN